MKEENVSYFNFKVIKESSIPEIAGKNSNSKYGEVMAAISNLGPDEWMEIEVHDDSLPSVLGTRLQQLARNGRKNFKITYRTIRGDKSRLFVRKVSEE